MTKNILLRLFISVLLGSNVTLTISAQDENHGHSAAALQLIKGQRQWFDTQNAAGMVYDQTPNYSLLQFNYDQKSGNFHRVYTAEKQQQANVYTEGNLNLGKVLAWGEFRFTHENERDARFNASLNDPYRGQPFFVVDSGQPSKWRHQNYHLRFRVATPVVFQRLTFGIQATYKAQLAAKQRDPRVDARFYQLQLQPGLTYALTAHDVIGASLNYVSQKEQSDMSLENMQRRLHYYELYGLGTAHKGIGIGRQTNYYGNRWGTALQYEHHTDCWKILGELFADKLVENVDISFTTPRKDAQIAERNLGFKVANSIYSKAYIHQINASFNYKSTNGITYLSQRDNTASSAGWIELHHDIRSTYKTTDATLNYVLTRLRDSEYSWQGAIGIDYQGLDDTYLLPVSVKKSKNAMLFADYRNNFIVGKTMNQRLLLDVRLMMKRAFSGKYDYRGANNDLITVREMEPLDEAFLTADAQGARLSLTYSQLLRQQTNVNGYVKLAFSELHSKAKTFNSRRNVSVTLGVNF